MHNLNARILAEVTYNDLVLDVGSGHGSYHTALVDRARHVDMLDAHYPALVDRKKRYGSKVTPRHGEALTLMSKMQDRSYDVVLGIDVVEHLEKADGLRLLAEMRRVGKRVVLFVPEGNHPQAAHSGNEWQAHRSTWWAPDLEAIGFMVERWENFHSEPGKDSGAMFVTWSE